MRKLSVGRHLWNWVTAAALAPLAALVILAVGAPLVLLVRGAIELLEWMFGAGR